MYRVQTNPAAQAEDGVEDRTDGAGQHRSRVEGGGASGGAAPTQESRPIGFVLDVSNRDSGRPLRPRQHVQRPDRLLIAGTRAASAQQRRRRRQILGLQKQLGERRMRLVGAPLIEGDLRVAGHVQRAAPRPLVAQRDAADLGIRIGGDRHFVKRRDVPVAATEDGAVRPEGDLVVVGVPAERLAPGRPSAAGIEVANVAGTCPQPSRVASSRQRVTSSPSQALYPLPLPVRTTP